MTAIKLHEFACSPFKDQANQSVLQGQGFTLIDPAGKLQPGSNYFITIHKISTAPDVVIEVPEDPSSPDSQI